MRPRRALRGFGAQRPYRGKPLNLPTGLCTGEALYRALYTAPGVFVRDEHYRFTNYIAKQGGDFVFRYSITSGTDMGTPVLVRFGSHTRAPLRRYKYFDSVTAHVGPEARSMRKAAGSFFAIGVDHAELAAFKTAEDGDGYLLVAGDGGPRRHRRAGARSGLESLRFRTGNPKGKK